MVLIVPQIGKEMGWQSGSLVLPYSAETDILPVCHRGRMKCKSGWTEKNQAWINGPVNHKNRDYFKPLHWMWSPDKKCMNRDKEEQRTVLP